MKRNIGIFLSGIIALIVLSCGGPKSSNATPQAEQKTVQDTTKIANNTVNSNNANTTTNTVTNTTATPAKRANDFPIGKFIVIAIVYGGGMCAVVWLIIEVIRIKKRINQIKKIIEKDFVLSSDLKHTIRTEFNNLMGAQKVSPKPSIEQKNYSVQGNKQPLEQKKDDKLPAPVSDLPMPTKQPPHEDTEAQYLEHYGYGILRVVSSKNQAQYQVSFPIGQNEGKFEFVGDAIQAIKNRSAILDDVCEAKNYNPNATQIHTDKWGTCIRQQDGSTWKVTEKAQISYK